MKVENAQPTLLSAAWVIPMDGPAQRDGAVVMAGGRIAAVGARRQLREAWPGAMVEDLPGAALLPGLVNAHVHLELSDLSPGPAGTGFVPWILDLMGKTAARAGSAQQGVQRAVAIGVEECLRFGVTTVGDISKQCMFTRPALRDGPLRVVSFGEIQAMAGRRDLLDERFAVASDLSQESERLIVGVTPHAPYTVEPQGYRRCLDFCRQHRRPLATHLAENPEEAVFLAEQTGPFRHLWEVGVNAWDESVPKYRGGPIRLARDMGLLDYPTLLAHVNYCDDDEMAILAAGQASVVYCPRTHQYFGHRPHRWREMLAGGINVAAGTDSRASSADLNLLDDLRLLHELAPELEAPRVWRMGTSRGARALQMEGQVGSLTVGKRADLIAFAVRGERPLVDILESDAFPVGVWIDGKPYGKAIAGRG